MFTTHESARTEIARVDGEKIAYRRFGRSSGVPLIFFNYFAANLDDWDPVITNGFAHDREVIIFDYPGVGLSSGRTPSTVAELAKNAIEFIRALDLRSVDVIGFSLGGMVAQQLAIDHPAVIRRVITLGTGPRGGENMTAKDLRLEELDDPIALLMNAFFTQSEEGKAAGRAYIERLGSRSTDRDAPVARESAAAQLAAIREWGVVPAKDRYGSLEHIQQPTLIVHGSKDVVIAPINALILEQHIPNAQLVMYPDASHGAQSQHGKAFLDHARLFLGS